MWHSKGTGLTLGLKLNSPCTSTGHQGYQKNGHPGQGQARLAARTRCVGHQKLCADQLNDGSARLQACHELCAAHRLADAQPVCQVGSIRQSCGKAQEANGQVCLCTDVAHAGHNHLQNGSPAAATAPMTVNQTCHHTSQGINSWPKLLLSSFAV